MFTHSSVVKFLVFSSIYRQAVCMADQVGVEPVQPRCAGLQQRRTNVPSVNVEEYYRLKCWNSVFGLHRD